jgi:predicted phosphate transport protein (TIGR00153 family)
MKTDAHQGILSRRSQKYMGIFEENARNLVSAALLLKNVVDEYQPESLNKAIREIQDSEERGDEISGRIYLKLNQSFITPFDRKDILLLVSEMDVALKTIKAIINRINIYEQDKLLSVYRDMAHLIYEASLELEICFRNLADPGGNKLKIQKSCSRIKSIEHTADEKYSSALASLFDQVTEIKILMSTNKILEMLERCVDELEDVADTIRTILVKFV